MTQNFSDLSRNATGKVASETNKMTDKLGDAASSYASDAVDAAKTVAGDITKRAGDAVDSAKDAASEASKQMTTFASALTDYGRANPLVAMGAALVAGLIIGKIGRS